MKKGFEYYIEIEKIREYKSWSPLEKLAWLSEGNRFRKYYPEEIIKIQDKFRKGEI